jgi:hypothetical protein
MGGRVFPLNSDGFYGTDQQYTRYGKQNKQEQGEKGGFFCMDIIFLCYARE